MSDIDGSPEEVDEDDANQDYMDKEAEHFTTVCDFNKVFDPTSRLDIIDQSEVPMVDSTVDGLLVLKEWRNHLLYNLKMTLGAETRTMSTNWNRGTEAGLRSVRAKPGRYTHKKVRRHLLRDSYSSHQREHGFYMTPEQAIDNLGIIVGNGSVCKEVKRILVRKSWCCVHKDSDGGA